LVLDDALNPLHVYLPETMSILENIQNYLHIDDEMMEKLKGGAIVATILLTDAVVVLVADDLTGAGTADDALLPSTASALSADIAYLIEYFSMMGSVSLTCGAM